MPKVDEAMPPPKKKVKGLAAAKAFASGSASLAAATKMDDVCPLLVACQQCVDSMYSLRHSARDATHKEGLAELPLSGTGFGWPVLGGGTFKDFVQRSMDAAHRSELLEASYKMVLAAGLLDDGNSVQDFQAKYLTIKDLSSHDSHSCLELLSRRSGRLWEGLLGRRRCCLGHMRTRLSGEVGTSR